MCYWIFGTAWSHVLSLVTSQAAGQWRENYQINEAW